MTFTLKSAVFAILAGTAVVGTQAQAGTTARGSGLAFARAVMTPYSGLASQSAEPLSSLMPGRMTWRSLDRWLTRQTTASPQLGLDRLVPPRQLSGLGAHASPVDEPCAARRTRTCLNEAPPSQASQASQTANSPLPTPPSQALFCVAMLGASLLVGSRR